MTEHTLRLKANDPVRIDGRPFIAGPVGENGRTFTEKATGNQIVLSNPAQIRMAYEGRISSEAMWRALTPAVREAVETDWDAMLPGDREAAKFRYRFVRRVAELPANKRNRKSHIQTAIDEEWPEDPSQGYKPTVRSVRRWTKTYLAAGKDIRSLTSLAFRRGRGSQLPDWIREEINKAIDQVYATQPPGTLALTRERAVDLIRARAKGEGRNLPARAKGQIDVLGINVISKVLAGRDQYEILVAREGRVEADRQFEAVVEGPQGTYPLEAVEVDHTPLDIMVVDEKNRTLLGRPWLTALIDRYSRCIIGFSISFNPPSWVSVMEALRHAVSTKSDFLTELGGITSDWPCHGAPDTLVCDNGRDFHSTSMEETEAALNMRILYLPRKKGALKGKIERWFRSLEERIFHTIPGTTFSNVVARGDYDSEEAAVMTLVQARWITAKWIVDVYHQKQHSKTGEAPADRWKRGILACGEKLPPPKGLLVPLTGMVIPATLSREGIKFKGLVWNSNAFSLLRTRIGTDANVLARIDPLDLQHAHVQDSEKRGWIEGDLVTSCVEAGLTLHQYEVIRKRARELREPDEDRLESLSRARREIFDFVEDIVKGNKKSKAGKRFARFYADGRKPAEHIAPTIVDPLKSASPLGQHPIDPPKPPPPPIEPLDEGDIEPLTVRRRD
ncbi:MAG: hypothetical protein WDN02_02780 [Methylovirgula sp.]|uniref:hypothetical protein n=1 Tax=Methylovirgula sp. TaxID=1978224 RepID=UPI00307664B4